MIIVGLRAISKRMGVTPSTIVRWHKLPSDPNLCFPLIVKHTGIGSHGIAYLTDTDLILSWLDKRAYDTALMNKTRSARRSKAWLADESRITTKRQHSPHERRLSRPARPVKSAPASTELPIDQALLIDEQPI